jgi:lipid A 3-O-deacylase
VNPSKWVYFLIFVCPVVLCTYFFCGPAFGSELETKRRAEIFSKGAVDLQLVSGGIFSSHIFGQDTPVTNVWQTDLRLGMILNDPILDGSFLRGNFEAVLALSYASIYKGPGSYYGGLTALLRYNFVQPGSNWAPYFQVGAGIVHNDAYKDHSQDTIGQSIEFTPQASLGLRYLWKENWSIDVEGIFFHISNAGLSERNTGLNSFGGFVGVTYFFDRKK